MFGLRFIKENENVNQSQEKKSQLQVPEIITQTAISGINATTDLLKRKEVKNTITGALSMATDALKELNKMSSTPIFKAELKTAAKKVSEIVTILLQEMDAPINSAIDKFSDSIIQMLTSITVLLPKLAFDTLAAFPPAAIPLEIIKIASDIIKSASQISDAVSDTTETITTLVEETDKSIDNTINKLKNIKNAADTIVNDTIEEKKGLIGGTRQNFKQEKKKSSAILKETMDSIASFKNARFIPSYSNIGGGTTRRKRFSKNNSTSKRVRFSV